MRLSTIKIPAKNLIVDVFIFLEGEGRFIFVDDLDICDNQVTVFFEEGIGEEGLDEQVFTFDKDEPVIIVSQYTINEEDLREEIKQNRG